MSENNHSNNEPLPASDVEYEEGSSQQLLIEFARNTYPLQGAYIHNNTIKGHFGEAQLQQPQNQKLILFEANNFRVIDNLSRLIIVKSALNQNKNQSIQVGKKGTNVIIDKPIEKQLILEGEQNGKGLEKEQKLQEQFFFSSESESNQSQEAPIISRKSSKHPKISKEQRTISKHILKKKLKYLHKLKGEEHKKQ